ncbi:MAG: 2'-5' RNA ligase family protein [Candidatus Shapirobacteria bacterium]|nr:2'-5' RNA ligase family protein [Candidatus Shapirobacteria bacterium]
MSTERYFLETHIPGGDLPILRVHTSPDPQQEKHLHITFIRPFVTHQPESVKQKIVDFCCQQSPISFFLEGKNNFDQNTFYIPVTSNRLQKFNDDLEEILTHDVTFDDKLSDQKTLHLTIDRNIPPLPKTEMIMTRLTCIRNSYDGNGKRIWFSYDFVTHETLNRLESLDPIYWQRSQNLYRSQH